MIKFSLVAAQQQMNVIGQQRPCVSIGVHLRQQRTEPLDETAAVEIVGKDRAALDAADDDVLQQAGVVKSCSAGDGRIDNIDNSLKQERPF